MDLKLLRRIYLFMIVGFSIAALFVAWLSGSWVTAALFPLSALLGWVLGTLCIVPAQRRTTIAIRRRGQANTSNGGWITGVSLFVGMYLIPWILRPYGPAVEMGFGANLFLGFAVALLPVLLDMRRPGYPRE
jgi:hypothetical protein